MFAEKADLQAARKERAIGLRASTLKNVQMVEDFNEKVIHYVYQMEDDFDTRYAVQSVEVIRPIHCNGVSLEPTSGEAVEFADNVVVGMKEYHTVSELRVGMTPMDVLSSQNKLAAQRSRH